MYIYKHHRICTDTGELIVAFIVAFAFSTTKNGSKPVSKRMVRALGIEPRILFLMFDDV
jgi:hypothetical protein